MLLHPILTVANTILSRISGALVLISDQTFDLGPFVIPWPFPFLNPAPVVIALTIAVFGVLFFVGLKLLRWLYGLIPFAQ